MKIDDGKCLQGHPLDNFNRGDCIRLVYEQHGERFLGHVYVVGGSTGGRIATCLTDGGYRETGLFVLEPTARVVIE